MSHKSVTVITKITLMKVEAEQAIMDYAKVAQPTWWSTTSIATR